MSDPNIDPHFDYEQLLSDHLDGWIEGDDRQALQDELQRSASLRDRYEALLADRQHLREMFQQDQSAATGLSPDFATRVVAEASRIKSNQVATIATVTPVSGSDTPTSNRWIIAGVIATAAALLLVASLNNASLNNADTSGSQFAQKSTQSFAEMEVSELPAKGNLQSTPSAQPEPMSALLADNATPIKSPSVKPPKVDSLVEDRTLDQPPMNRIASATRSDSPKNVDRVANPLKNSAAVSIQPERDDSISGAVLVYDVRLTTQGRVTQCVARMMKRVGMPETSRQPIDGELVDAAKSVEAFDDEAKFQLLYLRAPAKQLDRLFASLLRDTENVNSLALSLVTDSPILKLSDNLQSVDPTLIQHDRKATSLELQTNDARELAVLRRLLDEQTFLPLSSGTGLNGINAEAPSGSGRDVMSRVLLIVR